LHIFLLCKKRRKGLGKAQAHCIFIFNKKSHYFNKKQK
jgi:predicted acetyltransferase